MIAGLALEEIARLEEGRQAIGVSEVAAETAQIAGGWMSWEGPGSWANQACGLGLDGPVSDGDLDRLVGFYAARGDAPRVEVCPFADPTLAGRLERRGFTVERTKHVFARALADPIAEEDGAGGAAIVEVDRTDPPAVDAFIEVAGSGFRPPGQAASAAELSIGRRLVAHPLCRAFVAIRDRIAIGGAMLEVRGPLAGLFMTSVVPQQRGRGVQRALILHRLSRARAAGCRVATIQSAPGIATERNALRTGFRLAYSKTTLRGEIAEQGA